MNHFAITVDVESDSAAFADAKWNTFRGVSEGLPRLLDFFEDRGYSATLFIACDVLNEMDMELVRFSSIEIASHGYSHTFPPHYMKALPVQELRRNIIESKRVLSQTFKTDVLGFRAHALTVNSKIMDKISKHYLYDSSVITHRRYNGETLKWSQPYHTSKKCVVKQGELPIIEIPVSSVDLHVLKLPFIGSWVKWFPATLFYRMNQPSIVMNLHCQDPIKFRHWKFLWSEAYLSKLEAIITHYQERGYKLRLMREIAEEFDKVSYVKATAT